MSQVMHRRVCGSCQESFDTTNEGADECYACALARLIRDGCPETAEIVTARQVSGEPLPAVLAPEGDGWQEEQYYDDPRWCDTCETSANYCGCEDY